ncbi:MAG TPA: insecticidal delta-endotoxin Cry8Ea1 family protein, partial [Thermoanaerobaculia bacterium]|nr:insecticidal delta-endotoxin Cry8Ea1 family protein [Thermoanaerobaculia bacterium]
MSDDITSGITTSSISEDILEGGLAEVPYVGHILSDLVPTLWPGNDNTVWNEIESQTEALIQEEIDQSVYNTVLGYLTGLNTDFNDYLDAVNNNGDVSSAWTSAVENFDLEMPSFQYPGCEVLLLPLFAQAVNLYLSLLRDGALFGATWPNWSLEYQQSIATKLSDAIPPFVTYAKTYFQQGVDKVVSKTKSNNHACEPFRAVNAYVRQMTLGVSDYGQLWPFFDVTKYPNPVTVYLGREIYSDPVGTCDDSGNIVLPNGPAKPPNQITVWAWDRIDAVQLTYPSGQGPGGVTETARM